MSKSSTPEHAHRTVKTPVLVVSTLHDIAAVLLVHHSSRKISEGSFFSSELSLFVALDYLKYSL